MRGLCQTCSTRHTPRCRDGRRWPVAPLAERLGPDDLVRRLRSSHRDMAEFTAHGIPDAMADRWAVRCGLHPSEIWPEWADEGLTVIDRARIESGGWRTAWLAEQETA